MKSWCYSLLTVCREGWRLAVTEQFETAWTYCLSNGSFCLEAKQTALDLKWFSVYHMEGKLFFPPPSWRWLVLASCKQQKPFSSNSQAFHRHLVFPPPPSLETCSLTSTSCKQRSQRWEKSKPHHVWDGSAKLPWASTCRGYFGTTAWVYRTVSYLSGFQRDVEL